jgi:hypothetical protein
MEAAGRFMISKPQRGLLARFDHLNISIRFRRTGGPRGLWLRQIDVVIARSKI